MQPAHQEELERRLLALVRDYVAEADYNEGWQVDDVIVVFKIREPPGEDDPLDAWDGGARPGWGEYVAWTTTARSDWLRYSMLEEAMRLFHARQDEPAADEGSSELD